MSDEMKTTSLPSELIDAEREIIEARRACAYKGDAANARELKNIEATLRGLSISGGGIRSSTFSIGVLQSLAKANLFKDFDYVSTVSGGGYTGSMLSTMLNSADETPENFSLEMPVDAEESPLLQHLRNGSNYLTPGGFSAVARLPAVIVRGLILNFLLLLPFIMTAVYLTEVAHERIPVIHWYLAISSSNLSLYAFWLIAGAVIYFSLSGFISTRREWKHRDRYERTITYAFVLVLAAILLGPLMVAVNWAIQEPWHDLQQSLSDRSTSTAWGLGATLTLIALMAIKASEHLSAIAGKLMLIVAGIGGPAAIFGAYLVLVVAQVDSPFLLSFPVFNGAVKPETGEELVLELNVKQIDALQEKDINYATAGSLGSVSVAAIYCGEDVWLLAKGKTAYQKEKIALSLYTVGGRGKHKKYS